MPFHGELMKRFEHLSKEALARAKQSPLKTTGVIGATTIAATQGGAIGNQLKSVISSARKKVSRRKTTKRRKPMKRKTKRRIKRGKGLGTHEIKHGGRGTKGRKLVKFRDKRTGKMVSFYAYPKGHKKAKRKPRRKRR